MSETYEPGELFVYMNGDHWELGEVKSANNTGTGYFCWYSTGDTAANTPTSHMHKLANAGWSHIEKLREELAKWERLTAGINLPDYPVSQFVPKDLERENEKLRELVKDMWQFTGAACKRYPRLFDQSAQGGQMVMPNMLDSFERRMRELGIEVDA